MRLNTDASQLRLFNSWLVEGRLGEMIKELDSPYLVNDGKQITLENVKTEFYVTHEILHGLAIHGYAGREKDSRGYIWEFRFPNGQWFYREVENNLENQWCLLRMVD